MPRPKPAVFDRPSDHECPNCGAETEPIEVAMDGPRLQQLQLCPACYVVTWLAEDGFHVTQGLPMKDGAIADQDTLYCLHQQRPALC